MYFYDSDLEGCLHVGGSFPLILDYSACWHITFIVVSYILCTSEVSVVISAFYFLFFLFTKKNIYSKRSIQEGPSFV
jgi:hypothetical protein